MKKCKYWIMLNMISSIDSRAFFYIIEKFKTPENFFNDFYGNIKELNLTTRKLNNAIKCYKNLKIDEELELIEKLNIKIIRFIDEKYPKRLLKLYDPPPILYIIGNDDLNFEKSLGVIGTRKPDEFGKHIAKEYSKEIAKHEIPIISGFAYGIDINAHLGAVESQGKTVCVLGSGLNGIYPASHKKYINKIVENNGSIITEFPCNAAPLKFNFIQRNRVIAALSDYMFVVQAKKRSGTSITVNYALELGCSIGALPGNINIPIYEGTNNLIKNGADLVDNVDEILYRFGIENLKQHKKDVENLNENEKIVLNSIKTGNDIFDTIYHDTNMEYSIILSTLISLKLKNYIDKLPNDKYIIKT